MTEIGFPSNRPECRSGLKPFDSDLPKRGWHILLVSVLFPPDQGGVEAAAAEFAMRFLQMGCKVTVATTTRGACLPDGGDVRVFPEDGFPERVGSFARALRPDLVFVNGLRLNGGMGFPLDLDGAAGIPVVYRSHGFNTTFQFHWRHPPFFGIPSFFRSFWTALRNDRKFASLDQTVFLDEATGVFQNFDILLAKRFHPWNVSFIPNAFASLFDFGPNRFRVRFGFDAEKPVFLCVANYCDRKGQGDAVRIIRRHPELDAQFAFVGSERNDTLDLVERLARGDDRVRLLHGIARSDVIAAINDCDAAFLFARQEQQPLFLLEAMSCGKPWFCTDVGSVSKMRGGIVLRRRNERCFVNAVKDLFSENNRRNLGAEGKAFWESNYSPDVVYARWQHLLDDVIAGQAKGGY